MVVAVQPRRAVAAGAESIGGDEGAGRVDLSAEVRRVEAAVEDRLVDLAEVGEGEQLRQQTVRDAACLLYTSPSPRDS